MSRANNPAVSAASESRSKQSLRTWLRLLSCKATIERHLRTQFRMHCSVTLPQFDVLSELERAGSPLTMSQLSIELMVSNGNITGIIDRLEKAGFVRRSRPAHDRRIQYIELTEYGTRNFRRIAKLHEEWIASLLSDLTIRELDQLQDLLLKARKSINASAAV